VGMGNEYTILVENPERKRPLCGCRHSWEGRIKCSSGNGMGRCGLDLSGSE
jgi:hypothetical protein